MIKCKKCRNKIEIKKTGYNLEFFDVVCSKLGEFQSHENEIVDCIEFSEEQEFKNVSRFSEIKCETCLNKTDKGKCKELGFVGNVYQCNLHKKYYTETDMETLYQLKMKQIQGYYLFSKNCMIDLDKFIRKEAKKGKFNLLDLVKIVKDNYFDDKFKWEYAEVIEVLEEKISLSLSGEKE